MSNPFAPDRYHRLAPYLVGEFGQKVHKVTLRGGFSCPNRDGRISTRGCSFCSESSLVPLYGIRHGPIEAQLEAGLNYMKKRFGSQAGIAYFQEGCSTDAPLEVLRKIYQCAISHPDIVALSVGTRPDTLPAPVLEVLAEIARTKPVWLELGLQTANDRVLQSINRGHSVADFCQTVERVHGHGIQVIAHVILDLPTETAQDRLATAQCLNQLGVDGVKIHNLHILLGTPLADEYEQGRFQLRPLADYARIASEFLAYLDPRMVIHRLSGEGPSDLMLAPVWGLDKANIHRAIETAMEQADSWQGKFYTK